MDDFEIPETGAVFTFGRSRFAENVPSKFFVKRDPVVSVACGDEHTAVLVESGRLFVFGSNTWGQLGLGHTKTVNKPSCLKSLKPERILQVSCGKAHTLVSTAGGKLYAFGCNSENQLGTGNSSEDQHQPVLVLGIEEPIRQLAAGFHHSLALTVSGRLYGWGSNSEGQLGLGEVEECPTPRPLTWWGQEGKEEEVANVACGYYHTALVTCGGQVYTFGESEGGKLGVPEDKSRKANKVHFEEEILRVFCGGGHTLALSKSGVLYSFGSGRNGQLGLGPEVLETSVPSKVASLENQRIEQVSCGEGHSAVVTTRGHLYTFGDGRHGKLCLEQEDFQPDKDEFLPTRVVRFKGHIVHQVCCGGCHTMVVATKNVDSIQSDSDAEETTGNLLMHNGTSAKMEPSSAMSAGSNTLPPLQRLPPLHKIPGEGLNSAGEEIRKVESEIERLEKSLEEKLREEQTELDSLVSRSDAEVKPADDEEEPAKEGPGDEEQAEARKKEEDDEGLETVELPDETDKAGSTDATPKKEGRITRFFNSLRRRKQTGTTPSPTKVEEANPEGEGGEQGAGDEGDKEGEPEEESKPEPPEAGDAPQQDKSEEPKEDGSEAPKSNSSSRLGSAKKSKLCVIL